MVKCPNCGKDVKSNKSWSYWLFNVQAYSCGCGTNFRRYSKNGKHVFTLKHVKGKRWQKV